MREILESSASQALFKVAGQIDTGMVEAELVQTEVNRWPGWARRSAPVPEVYWERLRSEWDAADCVAVNSDWSREAWYRSESLTRNWWLCCWRSRTPRWRAPQAACLQRPLGNRLWKSCSSGR